MRINGQDSADAAVRQEYARLQGEINQFYSSIRQSIDISGSPGSKVIRKLPNGGQLRYTNNQGLEVIDVQLQIVPVEESRQQIVRPELVDAVLAIDVLFEQTAAVAGDVTTYWEDVVSPGDPGSPGAPFPTAWVDLFAADPLPFSPSAPSGPSPGWASSVDGSIGPSGYYKATGALDGLIGPYLTSALGTAMLTSLPGVSGPSISEVPFTLVYGRPIINISAGGTLIDVVMGWTVPGAPIPIDPTPPDIRKYYTRDTYKHLNSLLVAGLQVGVPGDGGYSTKSVVVRPPDDKRLKALAGGATERHVTRQVTLTDPEPNIVGCGFVARRRDSSDPETILDVYAASCNVVKTNSYPDGKNVTIGADDPSFTYTTIGDVRWTVRAREYINAAPVAFGVTIETEQETQHFTAPEIEIVDEGGTRFEPGYNVPPTVAEPLATSHSGRSLRREFAALRSWVDVAGDADPTDDPSGLDVSLGNKLAELSGTKTLVGPSPLEREWPTEALWDDAVSQMTKIATIRWIAGGASGPGKVEITPA